MSINYFIFKVIKKEKFSLLEFNKAIISAKLYYKR